MSDPIPGQNEKLNTVIVIGLLIIAIACLVLYGGVYAVSKASDGQILQIVSLISGGLIGFIARGVAAHLSEPPAPAATVNTAGGDATVNQPQAAPVVDDAEKKA